MSKVEGLFRFWKQYNIDFQTVCLKYNFFFCLPVHFLYIYKVIFSLKMDNVQLIDASTSDTTDSTSRKEIRFYRQDSNVGLCMPCSKIQYIRRTYSRLKWENDKYRILSTRNNYYSLDFKEFITNSRIRLIYNNVLRIVIFKNIPIYAC